LTGCGGGGEKEEGVLRQGEPFPRTGWEEEGNYQSRKMTMKKKMGQTLPSRLWNIEKRFKKGAFMA